MPRFPEEAPPHDPVRRLLRLPSRHEPRDPEQPWVPRTGKAPPAGPLPEEAGEREDRPRWDRLEHWLDEAIRDAEARGLFRDLEGRGRPLDLTPNPFEPAAWRMGHRLLRQHGFAPEWIELDKEIRRELEAARAVLRQALELKAAALARAALPSGQPRGPVRGWRLLLQRALRAGPATPEPGFPDPSRLETIAWEAERQYRARMEEINRLIARYNLIVPIPWLQRRRVRPEEDLAQFRQQWEAMGSVGRPGEKSNPHPGSGEGEAGTRPAGAN